MKIVYVFILFMLTGCSEMLADSNATRYNIAQTNANAQIAVAQTQANAVVQSEMYRSNAEIMQAQVNAMADVSVNSMWVSQIPIVLVGLGVIILLAIILHYRGKVALEKAKYADANPILETTYRYLPSEKEDELLENYVRKQNGKLIYHNEIPYLLTQQGQYKRLSVKYE